MKFFTIVKNDNFLTFMSILKNLQFVSDIHLEQKSSRKLFSPKVIAENIALLGDIGNPFECNYAMLIENCAEKFKHVFLLAGNHEYYNNEYFETNNKIQDISAKFDNVHFMNNSMIQFDNVDVIGTTLWSNISANAAIYMNDYKKIRFGEKLLTRNDTIALHTTSVNFISNMTKNTTWKFCVFNYSNLLKPVIVLSHHSPSFVMNGKYRNSPAASGFSTDLSHIIQPPIKWWLCGHTHQNITHTINNVVLKSNCYEQEFYNEESPIDF